MIFSRLLLYLAGITTLFLSCRHTPAEYRELVLDWQFKHADSSDWMPATVPGCAHLDLLANVVIPDPFFGDNEQHMKWIGESDWEYRATFPGDGLMDKMHVEFVFEGLDTYARAYLNDSLLFSADNMFRTWTADVKKLLKPGQNELFIRFHAPGGIESEKASTLSYELPDKRGFTRKAPFQYGWDWGPEFITAGIWKPVYLRAWDDARIDDVQLIRGAVNDSLAQYKALIHVEAMEELTAIINLLVNDDEYLVTSGKVKLSRGINTVPIDVSIQNPRLWWPAGLGEQPLYEFLVELETPVSKDAKKVRTGIRKAELVREKDSVGETFYFRINGHPVFMKGANYIPQDNFPTRVTREKYRRTLQAALDANMNMLRVWGGGIYEDDYFYDYCDEKGILVWQDFMFACNMYPGDQSYLENVEQEALEQVKRLRNHPSVVAWCGNNEVDEGWHNWGWQQALGYSAEDSSEVWSHYQKIFHEILPGTVADHAPGIPYIPSSPRIGWGHEEALLEGDMHYWGVWWGEEPFDVYEQKVGRFMSEFGFQGFPDLRTLYAVTGPEVTSLDDQALLNHQKHPRGMELINTYMKREYPVPESIEHYAYVSQLVQAYGVRKALEAHRRAKPSCMGTLYWQLNDCWPVISWSSVDYYNRWKALHYFTREAYEDFLISFEAEGDEVEVYIISDQLTSMDARLQLQVIGFEGEIPYTVAKDITIPANSSDLYYRHQFHGFDPHNHLLQATLSNSDGRISGNVFYFVPPGELELPSADVAIRISDARDGSVIRLSSPVLVKNVYLTTEMEGFFSENYFDLLPNQPVEVTFESQTGEPLRESEIQILHLAEVNIAQAASMAD